MSDKLDELRLKAQWRDFEVLKVKDFGLKLTWFRSP